MKSERVILVHGTGASEPGPPGDEKWWEGNSAFAIELRKLLNEQFGDESEGREAHRFEITSFGWSGANSESDRRKAGQLLARELTELEVNGVPYHLIGHSHGGSVVWHALKALTYNRRPAMLGSWTTVGTPFLTFGDRGVLYLFLFSLLSLFTLILVLFSAYALSQVYLSEYERVLRDAPGWAVLAVGVGIALATCLFVYSLWRLGLQLWGRTQSRFRRLKPDDYEYLGERWLSVIHANDEPMSGLKASVVQQPMAFAPRLGPVFTNSAAARDFAANGGSINKTDEHSGWSAASTFMKSASPTNIYNSLVAPLVDQFLWETVKSVLQGNDVRGEYLLRCDRAPPELERYWTDTSADLQRTLSEMANAAAAGTADALRIRLVALGSGFGDITSVKDALSWKEVLHTSYFEGKTGIAGTLSAFILGAGKQTALNRVSDNGGVEPDSVRVPYRPSGLYFATAATALLLCASATLSTAALERAWLRPYTNSYQDSNVEEAIKKASPTSLRLLPNLKDILVRWVLLDRTEMAVSTALKLEDGISDRGKNDRLESLQRIAFAIGLRGDEDALQSLLKIDACENNVQDGSCLEGLTDKEVRAYILVHAVAGGHVAKNDFDKAAGQLLNSALSEQESPSQGHLIDVLLAVRAYDLAEQMTESDELYCARVVDWAKDVAGAVDYAELPSKLRGCLEKVTENFVQSAPFRFASKFNTSSRSLRELIGILKPEAGHACSAELAFTTSAMSRCTGDRKNLTSAVGSGATSDASVGATGLLSRISEQLDGFRTVNTPACLDVLDDRLGALSTCLSAVENPVELQVADVMEAQPASEVDGNPDMSSWASRIWSEIGSQSPLCEERRLGAQMKDAKDFLAALGPTDLTELRRVVTLRTGYEKDAVNRGRNDPPTDEERCGWAILGIAWLRLGDQGNGEKLLKLVSSGDGVSEWQRLDFYLGIADAASADAPQSALSFLDQSYKVVDESDPELFAQTSSGSAADDFVYGKLAISHLYYQIEEYRLAALANTRINRLADDSAAYVALLDARITRARKYDRSVLDAMRDAESLPVYRMF